MSFILDALRKSDGERQRDAAPSLSRIPDAVVPRRLPVWAAGTMALLGLGVLGLGAALWLGARVPATTTATGAAASGEPQGPVAALPGSGPAQASSSSRGSAASLRGGGTREMTEAPTRTGLAASAPLQARTADEPERAADAAPSTAPSADAGTPLGASSLGPDATDSAGAAPEPSGVEDTADDASIADEAAPRFLASYQTAATTDPSLPKLQLEFHAFANDPARRFVYINGDKYLEGATLKEGPRVVRITADGVVVDVGGRQFLLAGK